MDIDLILAIAHHLAVFTLVAIFAAEFALLRPGMDEIQIRRLAKIDAAYGAAAGLVIIVGIIRVIFGAAGWEYYVANHSFWGKMTAIVVVGLLSIQPTIALRKWVKALDADGNMPSAQAIATSRRFIHLQAAVFLLIPIFAAAMARGYGS